MKWLRQKVLNWLVAKDKSQYEENNKVATGMAISVRESAEVDVDGLRFTVMPAIGGTIVQMRTYDRHKDRHNNSTYIIAEGEDVAKEVGRIVSMELLKV